MKNNPDDIRRQMINRNSMKICDVYTDTDNIENSLTLIERGDKQQWVLGDKPKKIRTIVGQSLEHCLKLHYHIIEVTGLIDEYKSKLKILKPANYENYLDTVLSNSAITNFYKKYNKKQSIPFPKERMNETVIECLEKLNKYSLVYDTVNKDDDIHFNLATVVVHQITDLILYDLYFYIKTEGLYAQILSLPEIDFSDDIFTIKKSAQILIERNGYFNHKVFYISCNYIVNKILNC